MTRTDAPSRTGSTTRPTAATVSSRSVGLLTFLVVSAGLLLHNRTLFRTRIWEVGDAAANSLLVNDAKHLDLLVGHYSRVGFHHPGPGVLYVQALGEYVFYDLLGVAAGPYNGQVIAVVLLQAAVVAAVVAVLHTWTGSWLVAPAVLATVLLWYLHHPYALTSTWIPLVVVAPFLLLLVSAASVAAGFARHLPLLTVATCLLVHAHVEFVLFGPVLCLWALVAWAATARVGVRAMLRADPRAWWTSLGIALVFAAPIALNTVLNWPGEVPKYLSYSSETERPTPTAAEVLEYARQFWAEPSPIGRYVPLLYVGAALLAAAAAPRRLRRPLLLLTGTCVLAEALFVGYARVGIDDLQQDYVGLFSWSVPLALLLVVVGSLAAHLTRRTVPGAVVALAGSAACVVAFTQPGFDLRPEGFATLPQAVRTVEQNAGGAVAVLDIGPGLPPFIDGTGLLIALERDDRPVCVADAALSVQVTPQRVCSPAELAQGVRVQLRDPTASTPPAGAQVPGGLGSIAVQPR